MFFKVTIDGETYELEKLTLGDCRIMRQHFGLTSFATLNPDDPDHMTGLLYCAAKRANPEMPHALILAKVEALDAMAETEVEGDDAEPETEASPTPAAAAADKAPKAKRTRKAPAGS